MNRRPGFWISGLAALLAFALVAAPLWDFWRYRSLRSIGPHVAVGVILPLRTVPPSPPARASQPPRQDEPAPAAAAPRDVAPATAPVPVAPAVSHASATPPVVDVVVTARTARALPRVPVSSAPERRPSVPDPGAVERGPADRIDAAGDRGAGPSDGAGQVGTGWIAVPVSEGGPQIAPEPQPAPPPPKPGTTSPPPHGGGDPDPTPKAIPILSLVAPSAAVAVGDDLSVSVRLSGASNVTSLPFHVTFDPAILEFLSAEEGPAIATGMQPILLASVSPARPGDLAVGLSLVESGGLLQGSGTVIRLQFRAVAPGSSALGFKGASIRGRISEPLDAQFQNAAVDVH
jgi:hypothetical protein